MTRTQASETVVSGVGLAAESSEAALLQRLRDGQDEAFGELYELHVGAVRRLARGLSADRSEADDITAETFFRVLQALRRGSGPRDSARAYLLTVARRVCWEWQAARREVPIPDDELTTRLGSAHDKHGSTAEHALITNAFASLPERWRVVLWQTEVEGVQPAVVAPHFGLTANATAALARRARLGLRAAYLQAHIATSQSSDRCRPVLDKLGGYTAGMVTGTQARKVRSHLRRCPTCRSTHSHLRDVCGSLRAHAGMLAVLVPASWLALAGGSSSAGSAAGTALVAFGTKLKVGLAVASTTAAGALVATPVVFDVDVGKPIGLPGQRAELSIASSSPPEQLPEHTSAPAGIADVPRQRHATPTTRLGSRHDAGGDTAGPAPQGGTVVQRQLDGVARKPAAENKAENKPSSAGPRMDTPTAPPSGPGTLSGTVTASPSTTSTPSRSRTETPTPTPTPPTSTPTSPTPTSSTSTSTSRESLTVTPTPDSGTASQPSSTEVSDDEPSSAESSSANTTWEFPS